MEIISKGAVARQHAKKEVFPINARKEIENEYKWRENVLQGKKTKAGTAEGYSGDFKMLERIQDVPTMRAQMKDFKRNYERGMPVKIPSYMRNKLWLKAKMLKDDFTRGMVSKADLHPVKQRLVTVNGQAVMKAVVDNDKLTATRAIERNQVWENRNQKKVQEFKRIVRLLEPDNKNIADAERFRPS